MAKENVLSQEPTCALGFSDRMQQHLFLISCRCAEIHTGEGKEPPPTPTPSFEIEVKAYLLILQGNEIIQKLQIEIRNIKSKVRI